MMHTFFIERPTEKNYPQQGNKSSENAEPPLASSLKLFSHDHIQESIFKICGVIKNATAIFSHFSGKAIPKHLVSWL